MRLIDADKIKYDTIKAGPGHIFAAFPHTIDAMPKRSCDAGTANIGLQRMKYMVIVPS